MNNRLKLAGSVAILVLVMSSFTAFSEENTDKPYPRVYGGVSWGLLTASNNVGAISDNYATGVMLGYMIDNCLKVSCASIEGEMLRTITDNGWTGDSLGIYGAYTFRDKNKSFFDPKIKLGFIENRFSINGIPQELKRDWAAGVMFNLYIVELGLSGAMSKVFPNDGLNYFSIALLFPL